MSICFFQLVKLAQRQFIIVKDLMYLLMLKSVSAIFYQIFISHQMIPFKNYEKCFLFHLNSFFILEMLKFLYFHLPLFFSLSAIALEVVYDVINCLNKNLITHFVWYLKKEKRHDIETLSIDRVLNKEHFY